MNRVIIDVREDDEFQAEHAEGAVHIPLSNFTHRAPGVLEQLKDKPLLVMCRGGTRAKMAAEQIKSMGFDFDCEVYQGGIVAWKKEGKPIVANKKNHLPIMRQVQIVAGGAVFVSALAAYFIDVRFIGIAGFFGAGLLFAGLSGLCMMAELLAKMPWNKIY